MVIKPTYKAIGLIIAGFLIITAVLALISGPGRSLNSSKINVVAAENFWGSLVAQIGGNKVNVFSVVADPNADPHEYESNAKDARDVASANYVIINGLGYDSWASKLLSAGSNNSRLVLNVGKLVGLKTGDNPHLWYSPVYVSIAIKQMEADLIKLDPAYKTYFQNQYIKLTDSLKTYQNNIKAIKSLYGGVKVAATEDVFVYLAQAAGLNLISPPAFTAAVSEGNDPPADSVVQFQDQITSSEPKVLVYNQQTVTPLTTSMKNLAAVHNIPLVGVTETIQPPQARFQDWMNAEVTMLKAALNTALHKH